MSAYKRLKKSDVFVVPYVANKSWEFTSSTFDSGYVVLYEGRKTTGSFDINEAKTSLGEYKRLIYDSMNHMFYQAYSGSLLNTQSLMLTTTNYESASEQRPTSSYGSTDYEPATYKNFPSESGDFIQVFSISKDVFGEKIKPGTFEYSSSASTMKDDGRGNLYRDSTHVGNIFYERGLVLITHPSFQYHFFPVTIKFKNEVTVYENYISCTVKEHEMNASYNPSLQTSGSLKDFTTGSSFVPYTSTIGLYNDEGDLLMVAKLAQPIPLSSETDMTFLIKYDK